MTTLADRIRDVIRLPGSTPVGVAQTCAAGTLEEVLGGEWLQQNGASCFVVETRHAPSSAHGKDAIGTLAARLADAAAAAPLVAGVPAPLPFVFFDLETTGLGGAAGTYAFLVGCGWFDQAGGFLTRQYLLVRLADEPSMLALVAGELARAGALVSFNGKSFDAPLLETRYLYHRLEWAAARLPHLDMLPVARRFWRGGMAAAPDAGAAESSCSLTALERQPLGAGRQGDVPGFEIPARYFHFVRTGDARPLQVVFEHNRLDLLSLAALTSRALHLVRVGPEEGADPREALALGWIYARAGLDGRARTAYERAVDLCRRTRTAASPDLSASPAPSASSAIYVDALRSLALVLRRSRSHDQAAACWRQILDVGGGPRHIAREASAALAIHHEHRVRDLASAKAFALRSLEHGTHPGWHDAVRHRVARIDRKLGRLESEGARLQFGEPTDVRIET